MKTISKNKYEAMERLSTKDGVISALAIDQRGSLKKMIAEGSKEKIGDEGIIEFKKLISNVLTPYSSSILLDPEYGIPATKERDSESGLLLAYEKTGYDAKEPGRLPDLLEEWSVKRLKDAGVDAVKFFFIMMWMKTRKSMNSSTFIWNAWVLNVSAKTFHSFWKSLPMILKLKMQKEKTTLK